MIPLALFFFLFFFFSSCSMSICNPMGYDRLTSRTLFSSLLIPLARTLLSRLSYNLIFTLPALLLALSKALTSPILSNGKDYRITGTNWARMQVMDQHCLRVTKRPFVLLLLASYLSRLLPTHTTRIADNNEPLVKEDQKEFMSMRGRMRTAEEEEGACWLKDN